MDQLELLKKQWITKEQTFPKLSYNQIYNMLLKKSSSIVKWLFYISIGELIFWALLSIIPHFMAPEQKIELDSFYNATFVLITNITEFIIILFFITLLYKAHKSISITDSVKKLIAKILKTRKIIKYYVIYNLAKGFILLLLSLYLVSQNNAEIAATIEESSTFELVKIIGIVVGVVAVFIILLWLFYKLLYGILLKRLNRNYRELKKLDV